MVRRQPCWSLSTKRIKLVVAYDGTDFRGWAAQTGQRTVQGTLTEAVRRATGEDVEIIGASRTDGGAHALGQVCHFDTEVDMEPSRWERVLNKVLEDDVAVQESSEAENGFHSRFCAEYRRYRYRIGTAPRDPFTTRYVHDYSRPLDLRLMNEAAGRLIGEHDFLAYTEELDPRVENTRRLIFHADVLEYHGKEVHIEFVGTAFLRGMMRRMSGALLEVGRGHRPVDQVGDLLTAKRDLLQWPVVLPAKGLCLMEVRYGTPLRDNRTASTLA
jgi:tRNA pseudouridine38-40 synthase